MMARVSPLLVWLTGFLAGAAAAGFWCGYVVVGSIALGYCVFLGVYVWIQIKNSI